MKNKVFHFFENLFDLRHGADKNAVIVETIEKNIGFRGANFWLLMFAILIASIGLNINSTPVIIGAMLISPLMGPIEGIGLSFGINDSKLLRRSMKNLAVATLIGIVVSSLYFWVTPINNVQSELLARTSPTIYDVLIALFGGFAGIVGSTRKEKGNVIPGVAIATALMPPLCTVGYGIATAQSAFVIGAMYLYAINCIFICLATLAGVKYLRLPSVEYVHPEQAVRTRRILTSVVVIMVIPALFLAYAFVQENKFRQGAARFVQEEFIAKGYAVIYRDIVYKSTPHVIRLAFVSKRFDANDLAGLQETLDGYHLGKVRLEVMQGTTSLTDEQWNAAIANIKSDSEKLVAIQAQLSAGIVNSVETAQILAEAQIINGKVSKISMGNLSTADLQAGTVTPVSPEDANTFVALVSTIPGALLSDEEMSVLESWLQSRLQKPDAQVHFLLEPAVEDASVE